MDKLIDYIKFSKGETDGEDILCYYLDTANEYWKILETNLMKIYQDKLSYISGGKYKTNERSKHNKRMYDMEQERIKKHNIKVPDEIGYMVVERAVQSYVKKNNHFTNFEDAAQALYPLEYGSYAYMNIDKIRLNSEFTYVKAKRILDDFDRYTIEFNKYIDEIRKEFKLSGLVNMNKISILFYHISYLNCLDLKLYSIDKFSAKKYKENGGIVYHLREESSMKFIPDYKIYILTNHSGHYEFDMFFHALFNNLVIVGIPSGMSNYDGGRSTPINFIDHDYNHISGEIESITNGINKLKNLYYSISNTFSGEMRDMLILFLWIRFHEDEINDFEIINHKKFIDSLYGDLYGDGGAVQVVQILVAGYEKLIPVGFESKYACLRVEDGGVESAKAESIFYYSFMLYNYEYIIENCGFESY